MLKFIAFLGFLICLSACNSLFTFPDNYSFKDRVENIKHIKAPVSQEVVIHWNPHAIPFITAKTDKDLAFTIGFLHAHLRIDQLEILRRISKGRVSEITGPIPLTQKVDKGIRLLNFVGAGKTSLQKMKGESLEWLSQFTKGLNWYITHVKPKPVTNKFIGQKLKPYKIEELLAISKLASADLNWALYISFLRQADNNNNLEKSFLNFINNSKPSVPSYYNLPSLPKGAKNQTPSLLKAFEFLSRSGSNSLVVSAKKSETGAGLIANDPHVGTVLPNFWLIMGLKSPSYHVVGLMIPGLPFIGTGRNPHIAWGGTNIRGISSHLYNVSHLKDKDFTTRTEVIKQRAWFSKKIQIRETAFGPVITDFEFLRSKKFFKTVALNWLGQTDSDELNSFLKVMKSKNWTDFKQAFKSYKVPALSMLYTDTKGNIGLVPAYGQPVLKKPEHTLKLIKQTANPIVGVLPPTKNLKVYNPPEGFIASANNKPFLKPSIPFSFKYSNNERINRLKQLAKQKTKLNIEDLKALQQDVFSKQSYKLNRVFLKAIKNNPELNKNPLIKTLKTWTGHYHSHSSQAVIFYSFMSALWSAYKQEKLIAQKDMLYSDYFKELLTDWIPTVPPNKMYPLVKNSLAQVNKTFLKYPTWGDFTLHTQDTILGRIPVIGSKFNLKSYPARGENGTLDKKGRALNHKQAKVYYGSSARHISDMSHSDNNYFVLNGGQDSWLLNQNLGDQTILWLKGEYIKVPLNLKKVSQEFKAFKSRITPLE